MSVYIERAVVIVSRSRESKVMHLPPKTIVHNSGLDLICMFLPDISIVKKSSFSRDSLFFI